MGVKMLQVKIDKGEKSGIGSSPMTISLRNALERLDESIDRLEAAAVSASAKKGLRQGGGQNGARNRTEVIGKLDAMIGRLESFLSPEAAATDGKR